MVSDESTISGANRDGSEAAEWGSEVGGARYIARLDRASKLMAAMSQVPAICKKISRSLTDLADLAQLKHSAAFSRHSLSDAMIRSDNYVPAAGAKLMQVCRVSNYKAARI